MTKIDLEKRALSLPDSDRVALAGALLASLSDAEQASLRRQLKAAEDREMETLGTQLEHQIHTWFDEDKPRRVWTADDWDALKSGQYRHEPEPNSLAVPPGWQPPRLKQG